MTSCSCAIFRRNCWGAFSCGKPATHSSSQAQSHWKHSTFHILTILSVSHLLHLPPPSSSFHYPPPTPHPFLHLLSRCKEQSVIGWEQIWFKRLPLKSQPVGFKLTLLPHLLPSTLHRPPFFPSLPLPSGCVNALRHPATPRSHLITWNNGRVPGTEWQKGNSRTKTLKHSLQPSLSKQFPIWNKGLKSSVTNFRDNTVISCLMQVPHAVAAEVFGALHHHKGHKSALKSYFNWLQAVSHSL